MQGTGERERVVVTGSSGKAGRAVVADLVEHGYEVVGVDLVSPPKPAVPTIRADLTDLGQAHEVLTRARSVVHLAAIPAPGIHPDAVTFGTNVASTYNVFSAAVALGLRRVVWASSETILGLPFDREQPVYVPIDEEHPIYPQSSYALSKAVGEEMARHFSRWSGVAIVGLRFSNIMEPADYEAFPGYSSDARLRKWNLWSYVDARDVAQSCRRALEAELTGAPVFIIAAADTVMDRPDRELLAEIFPGVPIRGEIEPYETLLSIGAARRQLGYEPAYRWRDQA
jgi:nucleoside-diphosphate-sugar epimerase